MKILIVRFSSIGDIVLTTPVVRCLHQQTGAEIHYLTKEGFAEIVQTNPYVKKVYTVRKKIREVIGQLHLEEYDYIIDLHKNLRTWELQIRLKKLALTFDKANRKKWLMVNFKSLSKGVDHIVHRYMKALKPLGVEYDGIGLDYFMGPAAIDFELPRVPFVCFAIGGTHRTKRMPVEKITGLCRQIKLPIYLLGGQDDIPSGVIVAGQVGHVQSMCGQLSLSDSARMIRHAKLVITHDTGLMHIAAAFHKPILSIWGNTVPEFGMVPFLPNTMAQRAEISEVAGLSCRPCSKLGFSSCPEGHFRCMQDQSIDEMLEMAEHLLSDKPPN